jgi:hypothetical protein
MIPYKAGVGWGANPNIMHITTMAMLGFAPQPTEQAHDA